MERIKEMKQKADKEGREKLAELDKKKKAKRLAKGKALDAQSSLSEFVMGSSESASESQIDQSIDQNVHVIGS